MVSKINGKAFHHGGVFFINNKRNGKKRHTEIHSVSSHLTVVPKYKNLFLYINLTLVSFAANLPAQRLSLISMLLGILWSSKTFVKTLRH